MVAEWDGRMIVVEVGERERRKKRERDKRRRWNQANREDS